MPKVIVSRDGAPAPKLDAKPGPDLSATDIHPDGHGAAMDAPKRKDTALSADQQKALAALREKANGCPLAVSRLDEFMKAEGERPLREFSALIAEAEALIEQALEDAAEQKHQAEVAEAEAEKHDEARADSAPESEVLDEGESAEQARAEAAQDAAR